jgi:mono/diheme cytochrome c family protein
MKNFIKLICVSVVLAVPVFSLSFSPLVTSPAADESNSPARVSSRALYLNNCARCHGADGRSDTELGRLNDAPDISGGKARSLSAAKLTRLIRNGEGSMPGFGKKLTKAQITSIVNYVRGL